MSGIRRGSQTWLWALLAGGALAAAVLAGHIFSMGQAAAQRRQWAQDQVLAQGRAVRQSLERRGFQRAPQTLWDLPGSSDPEVAVKQAALLLGGQVQWAVPPLPAPPPLQALPPEAETVERLDHLWVYGTGLPDGRLLVVSIDTPRLAREGSRAAVSLLVESTFMLALLLAAAGAGWKLARDRWEVSQGARDTGGTGEGGGPSPQTVVTLFQQTLKELRGRTEELEELHRRERSRAEDVERMAEALCANLEAGYLRFGEDGRLAGVNAAARSLLGLQEVPRLGDPADQLLRGRADVAAVLDEVRVSRALALREEVPGAPGVLLQVVGMPLFNLLNQLKGYLLILRDQSSLYQMRRTLREREALSRLGEVAAGVSHEVRNALSTISTRLRLLGQDVPGLSENPSFKALAEESRSLEQVMQNLLFFSRPLPAEREELDLAELLKEEGAWIRAHAQGVDLRVEAHPAPVVGDREALARALRNLTRNALEATADGAPGTIRLRLTSGAEAGVARLSVEDSGPGLAEEVSAQLFTPFFSQKPGGTGLGLAIARKVAREHGGDLVYFVSELGGAGFELTTPARSVAPQGPSDEG
jgi:two-component system, sensor histidine kinase FlrB